MLGKAGEAYRDPGRRGDVISRRWGLSGMGLPLRGARSWFEIKVCTHPAHPHHQEPVSLALDPPMDLPGFPS